MSLNLFEVFEEIRVKPDLENVFRDVEVLKVTASRSSGKTKALVYFSIKEALRKGDKI